MMLLFNTIDFQGFQSASSQGPGSTYTSLAGSWTVHFSIHPASPGVFGGKFLNCWAAKGDKIGCKLDVMILVDIGYKINSHIYIYICVCMYIYIYVKHV